MSRHWWKMNIATILLSLAGLVMNLRPYEGKDWGLTGVVIGGLLIALMVGIWGTVTALKANRKGEDVR